MLSTLSTFFRIFCQFSITVSEWIYQ